MNSKMKSSNAKKSCFCPNMRFHGFTKLTYCLFSSILILLN